MSKTKGANRHKGLKLVTYYILPVILVVLFLVQPYAPGDIGRTIVANIFLGVVVAALFGVMAFLAGRWMKAMGYGAREYKIIGITVLALIAAAALFFFLFFSGEKDIKVYDFSAYWVRVLEARDMAADSLFSLFGSTISSLSSDYTYVAVLPLVPLSYLFGIQYAGYALSIFFMYCLPACVFLALFAMRLVHKMRGKNPSVVTLAACIAFGAICPGMIWPIMNGYLDVCGVLVMALMLNVTLYWNGDTFSWKHIFALSALSLLLLLMRRWYAYYYSG